jgi:hypothetical protein
MQRWRGCLSIMATSLCCKEQHAMTQTAEPGIKSEHSESQRIRENGAQTNNTEGHAISDNSAHGQGEEMMSRA